jgi:hypothetical protein
MANRPEGPPIKLWWDECPSCGKPFSEAFWDGLEHTCDFCGWPFGPGFSSFRYPKELDDG